ncbi:hypothetical protein P775_06730 [Puniceibacterium antarcticum]|uniref:Uncharacterized protein n=1 Tax=Puniceibacterium antarcticum TaxID=1206336 RepID=A0A2G8RH93_9RHOB|nr:hypothetical protein P775_06730 [Puniceibacterium antarcticum]
MFFSPEGRGRDFAAGDRVIGQRDMRILSSYWMQGEKQDMP